MKFVKITAFCIVIGLNCNIAHAHSILDYLIQVEGAQFDIVGEPPAIIKTTLTLDDVVIPMWSHTDELYSNVVEQVKTFIKVKSIYLPRSVQSLATVETSADKFNSLGFHLSWLGLTQGLSLSFNGKLNKKDEVIVISTFSSGSSKAELLGSNMNMVISQITQRIEELHRGRPGMMPLTDRSIPAFIEALNLLNFSEKSDLPQHVASDAELHLLSVSTRLPQIEAVINVSKAKGNLYTPAKIQLLDKAASSLKTAAKKHRVANQVYQQRRNNIDSELKLTEDYHADMAEVMNDQYKMTVLIANILRLTTREQACLYAIESTEAVNSDSMMFKDSVGHFKAQHTKAYQDNLNAKAVAERYGYAQLVELHEKLAVIHKKYAEKVPSILPSL